MDPGTFFVAIMTVIPYLLKFLRAAINGGKIFSLIPFFTAIAASIVAVRYAVINTSDLLAIMTTGLQSNLASIAMGGSNALCWVSALGLFSDLQLLMTTLASVFYGLIGLMIVTAGFQMTQSIANNITLE